MSKRVFKYFAGFIRPHENWLNKMASEGWRLTDTSTAHYYFEPCEPSEYEYKVEFVAHKACDEILSYKAFLEELGYRAWHKNYNLDYSLYKAQWRPGMPRRARIATTSGAYNKELLIIEKRADGKPFELHADAGAERKALMKISRRACMGYGLFFALMAGSFFSLNIIAGIVSLSIVIAFFGFLIIMHSRRIRQIEREQMINE